MLSVQMSFLWISKVGVLPKNERPILVLSLLRFSEMTSELITFNHLRCHSSSTPFGTDYWKPTQRGTDKTPHYMILQLLCCCFFSFEKIRLILFRVASSNHDFWAWTALFCHSMGCCSHYLRRSMHTFLSYYILRRSFLISLLSSGKLM